MAKRLDGSRASERHEDEPTTEILSLLHEVQDVACYPWLTNSEEPEDEDDAL